MKTVILAALAGAATTAAAQPVVAPSAFEQLSSPVNPADTPTREFARTHQQVISAAHLASIPVGSSITQISFRASNYGTVNAMGSWPASTLNFFTFEVYLGRAARGPGFMSGVFAENVVPTTEVRVRQGPLAVPAASYRNVVAPPGANPWGMEIQLTPYVYQGGDLVLTIRHSGHLTALTPRLFVDSLANNTHGMQSMGASSAGATTGTPDQGLPVIVRFRYVPPPACIANCDGSTGRPVLTANDYMCFLNQYHQALALPYAQQVTSYANCDGSTTHPVLNIGDFVCFNNRFATGCP
ncbi:MAG: hypothetical protein KF678_05135 [Phycisphaeraceae bacterium]|nr:hypothetical protein [Phycisphaeraceae bacterium]